MSHDEARVRADFDLWWTKGIDSRGPVGIGVRNEARDAYLAAARHYSAEADALRADIRSFQDGYHAIAAALGTTVPETNDEDLVDRIERLRAERDRFDGELLRVYASLSRAESALPSGFKVDAEHSLADRVRELAEDMETHRDARRRLAEAMEGSPAPSPLTAARDAVVDVAMALADDWERPGINDPDLPVRLRKRAREYRSLQQQAYDPVREARDAIASLEIAGYPSHAVLEKAARDRIVALLDRALADRGKP